VVGEGECAASSMNRKLAARTSSCRFHASALVMLSSDPAHDFELQRGKVYPAIRRLWRNAWSELVPFPDYDVEIR